MSSESAKAYIERLKTDEEFKERVKDAADKEARMALVNAEGFDFSEEDIKAVKSELSDDELDGVSAGNWGGQHVNYNKKKWLLKKVEQEAGENQKWCRGKEEGGSDGRLEGRDRLLEQYLPVNRDQGVFGMPGIDR